MDLCWGGGGDGGAAASRCLVRANAAIDLANSPLHIRYRRVAGLLLPPPHATSLPSARDLYNWLGKMQPEGYRVLRVTRILFYLHFQATRMNSRDVRFDVFQLSAILPFELLVQIQVS